MPHSANVDTFIGMAALKHPVLLGKQVFAEFLGTFLYMSIFLYSTVGSDQPNSSPLELALGHGLAIASIVQIFGHVSGGLINPAITVGILCAGHIGVIRALFYVAAQVLGAICGAAICYLITHYMNYYSVVTPNEHLESWRVLLMEVLITFFHAGVAISVFDANRGIKIVGSGPLIVGLSVAAIQCLAHSTTWSVNPARTLGPAIISNVWTYHWVYWLGPFIGGCLAGLVYRTTLIIVGPVSEEYKSDDVENY